MHIFICCDILSQRGALRHGIEIHILQSLMGHKSITTTIDRYGKIYEYVKQKELKRYTEYMNKTNEILKYNMSDFERQYACI
jgi:integrase